MVLAGLAAAAWTVLGWADLAHPHVGATASGTFVRATAHWMVMMVAMMTPAVAPWVLAYGRLVGGPAAGSGAALVFAAGYFAIWLAYSVGAAALQLIVIEAGWLGAAGPSRALAASVLIAAGLFQFSPLKQACLRHCRNPLSYLLARWHNRAPHPFTLGLRHGGYCVGCCWLLMLTGFALGLMNLTWMAVLTLAVALEQLTPFGPRVAYATGALLTTWGVMLVSVW